MTSPDPPHAPHRPPLEEAFPDGDSIRYVGPGWYRTAFLILAVMCAASQAVILAFPSVPLPYVVLHGVLGVASGLAAARVVFREDRISSSSFESRTVFGTRRVDWSDVAAVRTCPEGLAPGWALLFGPWLAAAASRAFEVWVEPYLPGAPYWDELLVTGCATMGSVLVVYGVFMCLARLRGRMGFGQVLVARDDAGQVLFRLATWARPDQGAAVESVLQFLEIPWTSVAAGDRA